MAQLKRIVQRFLQVLRRSEEAICAVGLLLTTLLVFAQVVNRYWLHLEIMVLGDLALYCFIFFMFVAAPLATWTESHVSLDLFRERILAGMRRGLAVHRVVITALSIAILCVFLPQAHSFLLRAVKYPEYGTLVRWFNHSWLQIAFAVCMGIVLLHLLVIAVRDVRALMAVHNEPKGD